MGRNIVQSALQHCTQVQQTGRNIRVTSGCRAGMHVKLPHVAARQCRVHRSVALAHNGRCAAARRAAVQQAVCGPAVRCAVRARACPWRRARLCPCDRWPSNGLCARVMRSSSRRRPRRGLRQRVRHCAVGQALHHGQRGRREHRLRTARVLTALLARARSAGQCSRPIARRQRRRRLLPERAQARSVLGSQVGQAALQQRKRRALRQQPRRVAVQARLPAQLRGERGLASGVA